MPRIACLSVNIVLKTRQRRVVLIPKRVVVLTSRYRFASVSGFKYSKFSAVDYPNVLNLSLAFAYSMNGAGWWKTLLSVGLRGHSFAIQWSSSGGVAIKNHPTMYNHQAQSTDLI